MTTEPTSYVLFDVPPGTEPRDRGFLEQSGHPVVVCHGPPHGELCPILATGDCPLASGAEGIVFELDLTRPQHRAILLRYKRSLREDLPIWVIVDPSQAARYSDLLRGLEVVFKEPVAGDLDRLVAQIEATG